ncbi:MAG TPA: hypothetical protein VGP06_05880 [Janthinobacterium sp.]|jgi:hypothetical protein|nr:hypothetical protein [Janthinobacterium sp.]
MSSDSRHEDKAATSANSPEIRFGTLLYRFLFFDWLFADMREAKTRLERHAVWRHNRAMRRYLPLYLRRWSVLTVLDFGLGCLFERMLATGLLAACFFTCSCIAVTGAVIISLLWVLLANPEMP